ncbi:hypothetical protein AMATHDRAFT_54330 [Amanita thiersii Skay4041]|uniref:Ribonuclease H2 subunit B n=1 Tax=Amanita thiersii Skay4041 TaxID=703135 RepID=A0A2A9NUM6_9AGAR|nr:hypothetical protein AMATHDRAFT_54330 [Amanita thiersii Skay4041]
MATHLTVLPVDLLHGWSTQIDLTSFLLLPHPRTGIPCLFYAIRNTKTQSQSILEVHSVEPTDGRSWFLGEEVITDGRLLIFTPVDPVFLLLPILQATNPLEGIESHFRPAADIFDEASSKLFGGSPAPSDVSTQVLQRDILQFSSLDSVRQSLHHVCDVKAVAQDVVVYRYSSIKVIEYLKKKVSQLMDSNAIDDSKVMFRSLAKNGLMDDGNEKLLEVGRIRAACDLLSQYLPTNLRDTLLATYDFSDLDAFLKKTLEQALSVIADKKPTKQVLKSTGDKKRKGKASHGVEQLKKVNVNGMAKLSAFFKKA